MHDVEHDLKYSVFKVVVYAKEEFKFFRVFKCLTGRWSVGWRSVHWSVVGWAVIDGQWLVGRLLGGRW